jgi:hypothetical protein
MYWQCIKELMDIFGSQGSIQRVAQCVSSFKKSGVNNSETQETLGTKQRAQTNKTQKQ